MMKILLILILMVSVPFAYAVNNTEVICDIPNPTGHCYFPLMKNENANFTNKVIMVTGPTITQISDAGILLSVLVCAISITVIIIFGKDISKFIKKQRQ